MKITYFDTLYGKPVTVNVFGDVLFSNGEAHFACGGHRYAIAVDKIINIELM